MKIKVTVENAGKIQELLKKVNGERYLAHCFRYSLNILGIVEQAEQALSRMYLPKKYRAAARVFATSCRTIPASYKYRRITNTIVLERGSKDWFITSLKRVEVYPNVPCNRLHLTTLQRTIIEDNFIEEGTKLY